MNATILLSILNSVVVSVAAWAIKHTIDGAVKRWTDRIEKNERDIVEERTKRESLAADTLKALQAVHADIEGVREDKMDREEAMRENGRFRQTLENLLTGQARLEGMLAQRALQEGGKP